MPTRNTLVQFLAVYTNPESQNALRHRQTDRQTDGRQDDANSRSYCVAARSANIKDTAVASRLLFVSCLSATSSVSPPNDVSQHQRHLAKDNISKSTF